MAPLTEAGREFRLGGGPEFDLIRRFLAARARGTTTGEVRIGPGDDCAILEAGPLALSLDLSIEDIHFKRTWLSPREIGYRAAAAALSDLAAVAATPIGLLAALAVTPRDAEETAPEIMQGVTSAAEAAGAVLLGGDLSRSPGPIVLDIAVMGRAVDPVTRGGAQPGDTVWVTGHLGGAAAAVAAWLDGEAPPARARSAFARPSPRTREAIWLAQRTPLHAMIDLSDGLAGDAGHIAAASRIRIVIEEEAVPIHDEIPDRARAVNHALHGGEDYELLFTTNAGAMDRVAEAFAREFGVPLTRVGHVTPGSGVTLRRANGEEAALTGGFDHFRGAPR